MTPDDQKTAYAFYDKCYHKEQLVTFLYEASGGEDDDLRRPILCILNPWNLWAYEDDEIIERACDLSYAGHRPQLLTFDIDAGRVREHFIVPDVLDYILYIRLCVRYIAGIFQ